MAFVNEHDDTNDNNKQTRHMNWSNRKIGEKGIEEKIIKKTTQQRNKKKKRERGRKQQAIEEDLWEVIANIEHCTVYANVPMYLL